MKSVWIAVREQEYRSNHSDIIGVFCTKAGALKALNALIKERADGASISQEISSKTWVTEPGYAYACFVCDEVAYTFSAIHMEVAP